MLRAAFFLNKWLRWTRLAFLSSMVCREQINAGSYP